MLREGLRTEGLWSIARGLDRNEAEFDEFLLNTAIDQVEFMEGLMKPERLRNRIMIWAEEVRVGELPKSFDIVLKSLLQDGEIRRSMGWPSDCMNAAAGPKLSRIRYDTERCELAC